MAAIKDWLPITVRNRVALGFAFAALVIFVTWNFLPSYSGVGASREGIVMTHLWPQFFDFDEYLHIIRSPGIYGFLVISLIMALLFNGLVVLAVVPFWRIIHASNFLTLPVAGMNFAGGFVALWFLYNLLKFDPYRGSPQPSVLGMHILMALSMFTLGTAMLIFKNELGLRNVLELKKAMDGD